MVTETQLHQFEEDGYFILNNLFTVTEMDDLKHEIDRVVLADEEAMLNSGKLDSGINRVKEITFTPHLVKKDEMFQKFCADDRFVDIAMRILGPDIALYWDQAVYKRPETLKDFPWHQDNGYGNVLSEQYVTCWIALEDATIENGCIWVMKGSHKQGIVEHKNTPIGWQCYFGDDPGTPVPLKKGSMVVFSSLLFHRSGPNVSDSIRKGYILQYFPTHTKNVKTGTVFKKMVVAKDGKAHLDVSLLKALDNDADAV
ncbi:phytanoyl-CoA dioxygenase family protein [Paenibacillus sp. BC26]|uniref:phytanoyl-CoA dioxygenase family protein n=1 Tax=Paenibacillus sp. BC26 TaxID=1881032 RepID=UPI0008ED9FE2|nr:phytanoyl-CoA dioxygenase family protein [Paenibacillus sp. BC26]SFS74362.1 Phytanoyl-CoA dioxygenase (PhyH) [Paenibacillus sp. BC26]